MKYGYLVAIAAVIACAVPGGAAAQTPTDPANTSVSVLAGNSLTSSTIDLLVFGPPNTQVALFELVKGVRFPIKTVITSAGSTYGNGQFLGAVLLPSAVPWRCDRHERDFVASVTYHDGHTLEGTNGVKTPSCKKRLRLTAPAKAKPGAKAKVTVKDLWRLGDVKSKLCFKQPKGRYKCRTVVLRKGKSKATFTQKFSKKGNWSVQLRGPSKRLTSTVAVGVKPKPVPPRPQVLLLGDSLMSNLVTPIGDELGSDIDTVEALRGGSGLLDATFNWTSYAKRQIAKVKPKAAAMLIGASDGFPIPGAGGVKVACCTEAWSALYANKVAAMMKILRNGGKTKVVWIINPAIRGDDRNQLIIALGRAARLAAPRVKGVKLTDLGDSLTPGGVYKDSITVAGKDVRVRSDDGVHLTVVGADIAARQVVEALEPLPH